MMAAFDQWLQSTQNIMSFGTLILWMVYVYYTIRMFRQLKAQTDSQTRAYLAVTCDDGEKDLDDRLIDRRVKELDDKWRRILESFVSEAVPTEAKELRLNLKNVGASDVLDWRIDLKLEVQAGAFLQSTANTGSDRLEWSVSSEQIYMEIPEKETASIRVARIGAFPAATFTWSLWYRDVRGTEYNEFGGAKTYVSRNAIAFERQSGPEPQRGDVPVQSPGAQVEPSR